MNALRAMVPDAFRPTLRSLRSRVHRALGRNTPHQVRWELADLFVKGDGVEIGALHLPLEIPRHARVRYIDRMTVVELKQHYPELSALKLVSVDIIDNGEKLTSLAEGSVDFVIANHLLEHCQDPIGTIGNWLRVLRPGGVLYMAVPDKRFTFDKDRPVTPLEHLVRDHNEGPEGSKRSHFDEWARLVSKTPENDVPSAVEQLMEIDYSIHFHVWTEIDLLNLILHCRTAENYPFELEQFRRNTYESIAVLRKLDPRASAR